MIAPEVEIRDAPHPSQELGAPQHPPSFPDTQDWSEGLKGERSPFKAGSNSFSLSPAPCLALFPAYPACLPI